MKNFKKELEKSSEEHVDMSKEEFESLITTIAELSNKVSTLEKNVETPTQESISGEKFETITKSIEDLNNKVSNLEKLLKDNQKKVSVPLNYHISKNNTKPNSQTTGLFGKQENSSTNTNLGFGNPTTSSLTKPFVGLHGHFTDKYIASINSDKAFSNSCNTSFGTTTVSFGEQKNNFNNINSGFSSSAFANSTNNSFNNWGTSCYKPNFQTTTVSSGKQKNSSTSTNLGFGNSANKTKSIRKISSFNNINHTNGNSVGIIDTSITFNSGIDTHKKTFISTGGTHHYRNPEGKHGCWFY